jgi:hypothetical protein
MIEVVRTSLMKEKRRIEQRRGDIVVSLVQAWGILPIGWWSAKGGLVSYWMTTVEISDDGGADAFCVAARRADHKSEAVQHWDQLLNEYGLRSVFNDNDTGDGFDYLTEA